MRNGGCRLLDRDQLDEMCALREKGWSPERISGHFGDAGVEISPSAIAWQCMKEGADAPIHLRGKATQPTEPYRRGSHVVRPYTPADDAKLREMDARGARKIDMARELGRKPNSVIGRMLTLARRDARREEAEGLA